MQIITKNDNNVEFLKEKKQKDMGEIFDMRELENSYKGKLLCIHAHDTINPYNKNKYQKTRKGCETIFLFCVFVGFENIMEFFMQNIEKKRI